MATAKFWCRAIRLNNAAPYLQPLLAKVFLLPVFMKRQKMISALPKRRIFIHLSLFVAALSCAGLSFATGLAQFKTFVSSTKAAKGEFTQQLIKGAEGAQPNKNSSGSFVFARPGKFIWIYQKPYEQVLQADGEKLYIYDKDLNQVTSKKLGDALSASPAAILFGNNDVEKNFNVKEIGLKDGLEWLELTPKQSDSSFQQISIGLRDAMPQAMHLRDAFGQVTQLQFQKMEKNPPLKPDQFKFTIPKGADVFNQ